MAFDWKGPNYVFSSGDTEVNITEDKTVEEIRRKWTGLKTPDPQIGIVKERA